MSNSRLSATEGRRRRNRIAYRFTSGLPFTAFPLVSLAIISFHAITLATGIEHYEFHGFFEGFDYSFDLGGFRYHYGNSFGHYERTYRID